MHSTDLSAEVEVDDELSAARLAGRAGTTTQFVERLASLGVI